MAKKFTELFEEVMNNDCRLICEDDKQVVIEKALLEELNDLGWIVEGRLKLSSSALADLRAFIAQDKSRKTKERFAKLAADSGIKPLINALKLDSIESTRKKTLSEVGIDPKSELGVFILSYVGAAIETLKGKEWAASVVH